MGSKGAGEAVWTTPELDTKTGTGKILDALTSRTEDFLQVSSCFFEDISNRYQYNLVSTAASNSFFGKMKGGKIWQGKDDCQISLERYP